LVGWLVGWLVGANIIIIRHEYQVRLFLISSYIKIRTQTKERRD